MKQFTLIALSILVATAALARVDVQGTTALPAPQRKMLEQGKVWAYVYHHYEARETSDPADYGYDQTMWMSYYTLDGDTVIDGRQYMKMYRTDERSNVRRYHGAYREDDEGRVYMYDCYGDGKDKKMIDFSLDFDDDIELALDLKAPDSILIDNIKAGGQLFRRYRYRERWSDGNYRTVESAVEGIGFADEGLAHYLFEPRPTCICDYESLAYVRARDFWFDASAFQAPTEITLTEAERQLIASNNDFAFNLFRKARGEASSIMSPLSVTFALGMMNNGAAGQTQQEINDVLGFGDAGADGINQFCSKMLREASTLDDATAAEIANTIFVNHGTGYELQQGFVDKANAYYSAQPEARDFYDGVTWQVINQWASDHTHRMIPKVFDSADAFNQDAASYLLNAIYFKGAWANKFDKADTRDEAFGGGAMVPMMHQWGDFDYAESDLYQAVRLPYSNGAYLMTLYLPREGKTIADVLSGMNGHNWQFSGYGEYHVDLKLPRFKTETGLNLVRPMSELGMPTAFSVEAAEFPYFGNRDVFISNMFQKAVIDLDEEGTTAAAVTVIEAGETAMPREATFHANRPFFYIISEQSTGAIFFIGQYLGDASTGIRAIDGGQAPIANAVYDLQGRRVSTDRNANLNLKKGLYIVNGKKIVMK